VVEIPLSAQLISHSLQIFLRLNRIDLVLVHWDTCIRRPNEDSQFAGVSCRGLCDLDAGCTITYNCHLLALHIYTINRPERAMAHIALVISQARPVWEVSLRREPKTAVHEPCIDAGAIVASDAPFVLRFIPTRLADSCVVDRVFADVENAVDVFEISL